MKPIISFLESVGPETWTNGHLYSHMARPGIEPRTIVVRGEHVTCETSVTPF